MFLLHRPSSAEIERFLDRSRTLPLSCPPTGLCRGPSRLSRLDEQIAVVGRGEDDFARARDALTGWQQFNLGWVETFPARAPIEPGTTIAVLIRHLGFWSLNGTRVLYLVEGDGSRRAFGYAYGTLTNHAEHGEELSEVSLDRESDDVSYRIRAVSWPQSPLALLGHPIARHLQARFRVHSAGVMTRTLRASTARRT